MQLVILKAKTNTYFIKPFNYQADLFYCFFSKKLNFQFFLNKKSKAQIKCAEADFAETTPRKKRVIGGHSTDILQHPWQASLWVGDEGHKCGGSIYLPRFTNI